MRVGRRRVEVCAPAGDAYGQSALDLQLTLAAARRAHRSVFVIRPPAPVNPALFELEAADVEILQPPRWLRSWLTARWRLGARWARTRMAVSAAVAVEMQPYLSDASLSRDLRRRMREHHGTWLRRSEHPLPPHRRPPTRLQRRLLREPLPVSLRPAAAAEAERAARAAGLAPDARIVCVHAREAGYAGRRRRSAREARADNTRNASIAAYADAIAHLVSLGYTIVRLGDPSMTPLPLPGVVDLATGPHRSAALEIHSLMRASFLLCGESGPLRAAYLTNTPVLCVNATDPVGSYPIRRTDLLMLKTVVELKSGRRLTLRDMLEESYLAEVRNVRLFQYIENTPTEILAAVQAMLAQLDGAPESREQADLRAEVLAAAERLRPRLRQVAAWGPDDGFLGDGRLWLPITETRA